MASSPLLHNSKNIELSRNFSEEISWLGYYQNYYLKCAGDDEEEENL